jgi:copper resistance protein B
MLITRAIFAATLLVPLTSFAQTQSGHDAAAPPAANASAENAHGPQIFHRFIAEGEAGASEEGAVQRWDIDGWIGSDDHKLWLRAEGERADGATHQNELWALYSRNIATFWDLQAGLRHDTAPQAVTYAVLGCEGLAPYFFETQAHLLLSDEGHLLARLREENDFLLTQRLILQPYAEINLAASDAPEAEFEAGFTNAEIGLQTRYEIARKFAPYVDVRYERALGGTADQREGDPGEFSAALGLRLMF